MAYAVKYRVEFSTVYENDVRIDILEDAFGGSITDLTGISFFLSHSDSDKSKTPTVRKSELEFSIATNTPSVFIAESATQYKCNLYLNSVLNWTGWMDAGAANYVLIDGLQEIKLNAKDGLHLLEEEEFTDLSGNKPFIFYRITDLMTFCLNKTQLGLNFYNWISIYPDGSSVRNSGADPTGTRDPLYNCFVSARTFQTGEGEYESPFVILQKICSSFKMSMFQARGNWHFVYTEDRIKNDGLSCTIFNSSGVPQSILLNQFFPFEIGLYKESKFTDANALVGVQDKIKKVTTSYAFDRPPSLIRNASLQEGTFINYQLAGFRADYTIIGYTQSGSAGATTDALISADLYTANDKLSEKYRYFQFKSMNSGDQYREIVSTANPINVNDYFDFGFSYNQILPDASTQRLWIYLDIAITDNSFPFDTMWLGADGKWKTTRPFISMGKLLNIPSVDEEDDNKDFSISTVDRIPFTGSMQVYFRNRRNFAVSTGNGPKIWNIKLDYVPTISQGRKIADGQIYESYEDEAAKSTYSEELYISDALNIVVQGAITNSSSVLITNWFHEGVTESVRLGQLITRALWKFFYRNYLTVEGSFIRSVDADGYFISPLNTILLEAFEDKEFFVSSLKVDIRNEKCELTCVELLNPNTTDDFDAVATNENYRLIDIQLDDRFKVKRVSKRPPYAQYGAFGVLIWLISGQKSKKI
jgi:hypothetical protein